LLPVSAVPTRSPIEVAGVVLDGPGHRPLARSTTKAHG
jgi:hypothetical protein